MAFQDVSAAGTFKNLTKMAVGEAFEAYVVKFTETEIKGRKATNIVFQDDDGETLTAGASGNLKYMVQDGKIETGLKTRITRLADKKVGQLNSSQFKVEQDPDDVLSDAQFAAIEAADTTPATKKPNIKEAAEKLAAAQTAKRA